MRRVRFLFSLLLMVASLHCLGQNSENRPDQEVGLNLDATRKYVVLNNIESKESLEELLKDTKVKVISFKPNDVSRIIEQNNKETPSGNTTAILGSKDFNNSNLEDINEIVFIGSVYGKEDKGIAISDRLIVALKNTRDLNILETESAKYNFRILGKLKYTKDKFLIECKESSKTIKEIQYKLQKLGKFEYVEPDYVHINILQCANYFGNDTYYSNQWSLNGSLGSHINICPAWGITKGDADIIVAVVDDRIDRDHLDLPNIHPASTPASPNGANHGTEMAGIIGAAHNGIGVAGIAPISPIMDISIGANFTSTTVLTAAINEAWQKGASVINCSWASDIGSYNPNINLLKSAIDDALTNGRGGLGCVVVCASGNKNTNVLFPANYDYQNKRGLIAVGAVDYCGKRIDPIGQSSCESWNVSEGSCYGEELDIVAPGINNPTTDWHGHFGNITFQDPTADPDYVMNGGGTSGATAHVSGVVALMLSVAPCMPNEIVEEILGRKAQEVGGYSYTSGNPNRPLKGWHEEVGYGMIDAGAAVLEAKDWQDQYGMSVSLSLTNDAVCASGLGSATVSVTGGITPYTYTWYDELGNQMSSTSATINNLSPGTYSVEVQDQNCTLEETFDISNVTFTDNSGNTIDQATGLTFCSNSVVQTITPSQPNGSWTVTNNGGTTSLVSSNGVLDLYPSSLPIGVNLLEYTYTSGSCTLVESFSVQIEPDPGIVLPADFSICNDAGNKQLYHNISGGEWSGPGIYNTSNYGLFTPSMSMLGVNVITYTIGACKEELQITNNGPKITPNPDADIIPALCSNQGIIDYEGIPNDVGGNVGVWTGSGISVYDHLNGTVSIDPALSSTGSGNTITYTIDLGGGEYCSSSMTLNIVDPPVLNVAKYDFCLNDAPEQILVGNSYLSLNYLWVGEGLDNLTYSSAVFDPQQAGLGTHTITYENLTENCASTSIVLNVYGAELKTEPLLYCTSEPNPLLTVNTYPPNSPGWIPSPLIQQIGADYYYDIDGGNTNGSPNTLEYEIVLGPAFNTCVNSFDFYSVESVEIQASKTEVCLDYSFPVYLTASVPGGIWKGAVLREIAGSNGTQVQFWTSDNGSGTYSITYGTSDCYRSIDLIIGVPNAINVVSTGGPVCANASPLELDGGLTAGTWSGTGVDYDGNIYTFDPSVVLNPDGTTPTTLTYTYQGCSQDIDFTVYPLPSITGPQQPLCVSDPGVTLTATPAGGIWSSNPLGRIDAATGFYQPQNGDNGTHLITYTDNDPPQCSSTFEVTVYSPEIVTFKELFCGDEEPFLVRGKPNGGTWSVVGNGTLPTSPGGSASFDPSQFTTGTYTLRYTDNGGCFIDRDVKISNPDFQGIASAFCDDGNNVDPQFSVNNSFDQGGNWTLNNSSAATLNPYVLDLNGSGTYVDGQLNILVYESPSGCNYEFEILVDVPATISYDPDFCSNDGVASISVSGNNLPAGIWDGTGLVEDNDGYLYTMNFDPQTGGLIYADPNISPVVDFNTITFTKNACVTQADITVFEQPQISIPEQVCLYDDPVTLVPSNVTGYGEWTGGTGVEDVNYNDNEAIFVPLNGILNNVNTIIFTDLLSGCTAEISTLIQGTMLNLQDEIYCRDEQGTRTLQFSPANGVWNGDAPGITNIYTGEIDLGLLEVGENNFTYTYDDGTCINKDVAVVTISEPTPEITTNVNFICAQSTQVFDFEGTPSGQWSTSLLDGPDDVISSSGIFDQSHPLITSGTSYTYGNPITIYYTVTDGNGCTGTATTEVVVDNVPTFEITFPADACVGDPAFLLDYSPHLEGSTSGISATIPVGLAYSQGNQIWVDPTVISNPGPYTIVLSWGDNTVSGCATSSPGAFLDVFFHCVNIEGPDVVCFDGNSGPSKVRFSVIPDIGGQWSIEGISGPNIINQNTGWLNLNNLDEGDYVILYTYEDNNVTYVAEHPFTYRRNPTVQVLPAIVCTNETDVQTMFANPSGGIWDDGDPQQDIVFSNGDYVPNNIEQGVYPLSYVYTDDVGCSTEVNTTLTIDAGTPLNVPNVETCADGVVILYLEAEPQGGYWLTTNSEYPISSQGKVDLTGYPAGVYNFIYNYENSNGCRTSEKMSVILEEPPVVSVPATQTFCENSGIQTLQGATVNGTGFWSGPLGINPDGTFDPSQLGAGEYIITYLGVSVLAGCTTEVNSTLIINEAPQISIFLWQQYCNSDVFAKVEGIDLPPAQYTFEWFIDGEPAGENGNFLSAPFKEPVSISVVVTGENGCVGEASVITKPCVKTTPGALGGTVGALQAWYDIKVCHEGVVRFEDRSVGKIDSWNWDFGDGFFLSYTGTNPNNPVALQDNNGGRTSGTYANPVHDYGYGNQPFNNTYTTSLAVVGTNNQPSLISSAVYPNNVNPESDATFTVIQTSTTPNIWQFTYLTAENNAGAMLEFGDGSFLMIGNQNPNAIIDPNDIFDANGGITTGTYANPIHQYASDQVYTASLVAIGKCGDQDHNSMDLIPQFCDLGLSFNSTYNQPCGKTVTFDGASLAGNIVSWSWNLEGIVATGQSVTHTFLGTGGNKNVVLTATDANGCTDTYAETIFVGNSGAVTIGTLPTNICVGDEITVSATSATGETSFQWGTDVGCITAGQGTGTVTILITELGGQICTNAASGCGSQDCASINATTCPKILTQQPGPADGKDASVVLRLSVPATADANFGNYPHFMAQTWTANGQLRIYRSYAGFDISQIPVGATINSASLYLYGVTQPSSISTQHRNSNAAWVQRVTGSWDEHTITWNNQPATSPANQIPLAISTSLTQDYVVDVQQLLEDAISDNNATNQGMFEIMLRMQNETSWYRSMAFNSSDYTGGDGTRRPKLEISYTIQPGSVSCQDLALVGNSSGLSGNPVPSGIGDDSKDNSHYYTPGDEDLIGEDDLPEEAEISDGLKDKAKIRIVPNPSNGRFSIIGLTADQDIELYNTLGERISTENVDANDHALDLSDYPGGVYFLKVKTEGHLEIHKLILQK